MNLKKSLLMAGLSSCSVVASHAATLCVTPGGGAGCFAHINDAVAAASAADTIFVEPGTYAESVTIGKPLTLVGLGATIEAMGLPRGIFVDGVDNHGLANVHIAGFTVQDANFEGILVANTSTSSVSNNTVLNNNRSLTGGTCPTIDAWETGEAQDCGEGIHLLGADHVIVFQNTSQGNSGGILVSDDTGATHHNLVSFNQIKDNPYACGISLASHPAASLTGSHASLGVYNNTVFGNVSEHNGYSVGGGAGIGIFASAPTAASYGNFVAANVLRQNGHPGISLHSHFANQTLTDNTIVGNLAYNNGTDPVPASTPGPTGININSLSPATGNIISGNVIAGEQDDVVANLPSLVQVQFNDLLGPGAGVFETGTNPVDATGNWWGACGQSAIGGCSTPMGAGVDSAPAAPSPVVPVPPGLF